MNFEDYSQMRSKGYTRKELRIIEANEANEAGEDNNTEETPANPTNQRSSSENEFSSAEWREFMKSFIPFVLYIGPNRLEMMLDNFKHRNFNLNDVTRYEDPTGRTGSAVPKLRFINQQIVLYDPRGNSSVNESIMHLNEGGFLGFILRSILGSLLQQIAVFTSATIEGLFGKFKINPENETDIRQNKKAVEVNNYINTSEMRNLKYAIWSKELIEHMSRTGAIDNDDRRVTWVAKCEDCTSGNFKKVTPIGGNSLNTVYPWRNTRTNPPFDTALEYISRNFGVRIFYTLLMRAFR